MTVVGVYVLAEQGRLFAQYSPLKIHANRNNTIFTTSLFKWQQGHQVYFNQGWWNSYSHKCYATMAQRSSESAAKVLCSK